MQVILPSIYFILFLFLILKMKFFTGALSGIQLSALFCVKYAAGLAAHFIYLCYYPESDSVLFMEGSKDVFDQFLGRTTSTHVTGWNSSFDDSFYNNSRLMIAINFLIRFLSFNNVFVHILFFCFFSFCGLTALYKAFYKHFPDKRTALVLGSYLVPSVLCWTSGIYKESIALLCVGFIIYVTDFGLTRTYTSKSIVALVLLTVLLFFLKVYIVACLLPLLLINLFVSRMGDKNYLMRYMVCFLLFAFVFHGISKLSPRVDFYQLIADKQAKAISESEGGIFLENHEYFIRINYSDSLALVPAGPDLYFIKEGTNYLSWKLNNMKDTTFVVHNTGEEDPEIYKLTYKLKPANSGIQLSKMEPTFWGMSKKIPAAIATVFFQPGLFSIKSALQLLSWLENMWLLLLLTLALLFFDKRTLIRKEILMFCILFGLFQFATIGLTSPVVGAMVRYKVTALPFLFSLSLLCVNWEKLLNKITKQKDQDSGKE